MSDEELRERVVSAVALAHLTALQEKYPEDTVERLGTVASDTANQLVDQLITADRKRVALEARIDELRKAHATYLWNEAIADYISKRIAELKAQQEEA